MNTSREKFRRLETFEDIGRLRETATSPLRVEYNYSLSGDPSLMARFAKIHERRTRATLDKNYGIHREVVKTRSKARGALTSVFSGVRQGTGQTAQEWG